MQHSCTTCGKTFRWPVSLKLHQQQLTGLDQIICKQCQQNFTSKCLFSLHPCCLVRTDSSRRKLLTCSYCGKLFQNPTSLQRHERIHTGERPFMCTTCGKQFSDISTLRNHQRVHSGSKPYSCDECGKSFLWPNRLQFHKMLHEGINPFQCKLCEERLRTKKLLRQHIANCHGTTGDLVANGCQTAELKENLDDKKQPVCRFCHKQFISVYNARAHERIHTGEQPYHCTLCGRHYHDRSSLRVHMRTHTGLRPFQCRFCQKTFSQLTNLRVHNLRCTELATIKPEADAADLEVYATADESTQISVDADDGEDELDHSHQQKKETELLEMDDIQHQLYADSTAFESPSATSLTSNADGAVASQVSSVFDDEVTAEDENDSVAVDCPELSADDTQPAVQLDIDNLPFTLTANDKLFSQTVVVLDRIDAPRFHFKSDTSVGDESSAGLQCSVCRMQFKSRPALRRHYRLHAGQLPYTCNDCGNGFRWSISFTSHRQLCADGNWLLCNSCGKQFESRCHLLQHSCRLLESSDLASYYNTDAGIDLKETDEQQIETLLSNSDSLVDPAFVVAMGGGEHYSTEQMDSMRNPLQCQYCGKLFQFAASRKRHERIHTNEKPFMCTTCGKQFTDLSTLRNHQRVHSGVKPLKCDECDKKFLWPSRLKSHKLLHAGINPHQCKLCGERFRFLKAFKDHKLECTGKTLTLSEDGEQFDDAAATADEGFDNQSVLMLQSLVGGIISSSSDSVLVANDAGTDGGNSVMTFNKLLKCNYCDKQFVYDDHLRRHELNEHTNARPYKCPECHKQFSNRASLKIHSRIHTGERPHVCNECGVAFRWRESLITHLDEHADLFPHECYECGERFQTHSAIKEHRAAVHSIGNAEKLSSVTVIESGDRKKNSAKPFHCPICEKHFATRNYLKQHVLLHTNEMPYRCDQCGKAFRWQLSLRHHEREHSGLKPLSCKQCSETFSSVHKLKKHCLLVHGSSKIFTCAKCPKFFLSVYALARHEQVHRQ